MVAIEDVLMPVPLPARIVDGLSQRFHVVRLWEHRDHDAVIGPLSGSLRFVATGVPILAEGYSWPIDRAFMDRFPRLQLIANLGVGYDNIDAPHAAGRGITVTNTPDVLTDETADTAMGLLLCTVRQLPQADRYVRDGHWLSKPFPLSASLKGRTMGILGLGRIGKAIARRAESFGLGISYHGRRQQSDLPYTYFASLQAMAAACDILMVAAPGGPQTRHIVGADILAALGPDGILINIARGSLVDEQALISALQAGKLLAAGLDVFENEPEVPPELLAMSNVVLLPHVGSATQPTRDAMCQMVVDNIVSFARGSGPLNPVAETPWNRQA